MVSSLSYLLVRIIPLGIIFDRTSKEEASRDVILGRKQEERQVTDRSAEESQLVIN
jgi:hypothetical protein